MKEIHNNSVLTLKKIAFFVGLNALLYLNNP